MFFSRALLSNLVLAGLARATIYSVVYVTEYETNCNACSSSSAPIVVVAPSPVAQVVLTTTRSSVKSSAVATVVVAASVKAAQNTAVIPSVVTSTSEVASAVSSPSVVACPATAHTDALGSKNYPRVITPVSSTSPQTVYGPQYFGSVGGGNSTIMTFDYETAGTCTLEFKFPSMAQIEALNGTTSYQISGSSIAVTLYQLASVASPTSDYASIPARTSAYSTVLTPGTNSTLASFACPVGTSVSYELVATDANTLSWFEDYNPPPLGLLALMC